MQSDTKKIVMWCETWYMELSPVNCKVHLGKQTNPEDNFIVGKKIGVTE